MRKVLKMIRTTAPINSSSLIQQALQEGSNFVMDWLWYAEEVTSDAERRYCFERALYIDPNNHEANAGIKRLDAKQKRSAQAAPVANARPLGKLVQGLFHRA
jgi:hypothetical protein